MITFSLNLLVTFILIIGIGGILSLWIYSEWVERKRMLARGLKKVIYYCVKCEQLYASADEGEICQCPKCGLKNNRLKF